VNPSVHEPCRRALFHLMPGAGLGLRLGVGTIRALLEPIPAAMRALG
jgi:hypothetical protein